jgi:hypothetical protein
MSTEDGPAGGSGGGPTAPPAARKKSQKRKRNKQIKTPCTPEEYDAIVAKANDAGKTRAAWSRLVLLGDSGPRSQRRMPADNRTLRQILGHLGRVGNNLNQIAYQLNTGGPADLPELRLALKEYAGIRNAIFKALGLDTAAETPPDKPEGPAGK